MIEQLWSISFKEWNVPKRFEILNELGIHYQWHGNDIYQTQPLSSGQMEVWKFVTDPVRQVDFSILDYTYGRALLKLHTEFWQWRFKVNEIS